MHPFLVHRRENENYKIDLSCVFSPTSELIIKHQKKRSGSERGERE